jgi:hypothetical protein
MRLQAQETLDTRCSSSPELSLEEPGNFEPSDTKRLGSRPFPPTSEQNNEAAGAAREDNQALLVLNERPHVDGRLVAEPCLAGVDRRTVIRLALPESVTILRRFL